MHLLRDAVEFGQRALVPFLPLADVLLRVPHLLVQRVPRALRDGLRLEVRPSLLDGPRQFPLQAQRRVHRRRRVFDVFPVRILGARSHRLQLVQVAGLGNFDVRRELGGFAHRRQVRALGRRQVKLSRGRLGLPVRSETVLGTPNLHARLDSVPSDGVRVVRLLVLRQRVLRVALVRARERLLVEVRDRVPDALGDAQTDCFERLFALAARRAATSARSDERLLEIVHAAHGVVHLVQRRAHSRVHLLFDLQVRVFVVMRLGVVLPRRRRLRVRAGGGGFG